MIALPFLSPNPPKVLWKLCIQQVGLKACEAEGTKQGQKDKRYEVVLTTTSRICHCTDRKVEASRASRLGKAAV